MNIRSPFFLAIALAALSLPLSACAPSTPTSSAPTSAASFATLRGAPLLSPAGADRTYGEVVAGAPWTVFVFVSAGCPCLDAHKSRISELAAVYAPRGVQFVALDSEVGTTKESAATEARTLGFSFPLMVDPGAKIANALEAEYATYTVLVDRQGKVAYRGGVDSDKRKLHDTATPYLREALDDVLSGASPRRTEGKALGCMLRKW